MYHTSRINSGLQVATVELPHMSSVCVGLWVNVGSRHEMRAQNGAAHFVEHMLFKGTTTRSARAISEEIEGLGGYLNAFTAEENTCYYAKASSEEFEQLAVVLFDMFLDATFQSVEMDKERDVILEENAMYLDQPQHLVLETLNEITWPGHPLGRSITGSTQSLRRLNRKRLLAFRDQHYTAPNVLLVVAGRVAHRDVMRCARRFARRVPSGSPTEFQALTERRERFKFQHISRSVEQAQLAISFKTCSRFDKRRHALQVLNTLLGENMSSRLNQVLREEHGLAYSVYSALASFADTGTLSISLGLDPDKLSQGLDLIEQELKRLCDEEAPEDEVQRARRYLTGQLDLHLENTENHMIWVGEQLLGFNRIRSIDSIKRDLLNVTAKEVRDSAKDFFQRKLARIALVGPEQTNVTRTGRFLAA